MKRTFFSIASSILALSALFLTSCDDPIFYEIRKEVELEDADVAGTVNSMVRYKDDLYTQNGKLYRKLSANLNRKHCWQEMSKPPANGYYNYINKVAADESYLYVQVTKIDEDEMEGETGSAGCEIWCWDGSSWAFVNSWEGQSWSGTFVSGKAVLFCTNSPTSSNRHAYVTIGGSTVYKLSGASATVDSSAASGAKSAAMLGSNVVFSTGHAMCSNAGETIAYRSNGTSVEYSSDGSTWSTFASPGYTVYSLAAASDHLIVGTYEGVRIYPLSGGSNVNSSFTNTSSTVGASYYEVKTAFVTDPSVPLASGAVYVSLDFTGSSSSSSGSSSNLSLWSYFASRGSWNRE